MKAHPWIKLTTPSLKATNNLFGDPTAKPKESETGKQESGASPASNDTTNQVSP